MSPLTSWTTSCNLTFLACTWRRSPLGHGARQLAPRERFISKWVWGFCSRLHLLLFWFVYYPMMNCSSLVFSPASALLPSDGIDFLNAFFRSSPIVLHSALDSPTQNILHYMNNFSSVIPTINKNETTFAK